MAALTSGRNTVEILDGKTLFVPVKANTKIYEGSLVATEATGYAIAGKKAEGLNACGRAEEFVDNTGAGGSAGAKSIRVRRGIFKWENDTSNPVTQAHIMQKCYILDEQTVTSLATGASVAGKVIRVDDTGVVVETL